MKAKFNPAPMLVVALAITGAAVVIGQQAGVHSNAAPSRTEGPCDIYATAGDPCVAAHSTTRALYASYNGPLYQVVRQSDGKSVRPEHAGGRFCRGGGGQERL